MLPECEASGKRFPGHLDRIVTEVTLARPRPGKDGEM